MADRYVLELLGEQALLNRLSAAIQGLEHPRELFANIGAALEQSINIRFDTKRDPTGQAWPKISEITPLLYYTLDKNRRAALKKDADGELIIPPMPGTLLERSRKMRRGIGSNADDQGVEVGFADKYAIYHETGTKRNDRPFMPRRGLMFADPVAGTLSADDQADVITEIEAYLSDLLAG